MNEIGVDAMMEQIRSELPQASPTPPRAAIERPSIDEVLARARAELAHRRRQEAAVDVLAGEAAVAAAEEGPWHPAADRLPGQREYVLADLLKYGDVDFIEVVYRTLLRRPPDPAGFEHYLKALRGGVLTKVEILGQIRWSDEGVARGIHVDGLLIPYTVQKWHRKRYVGPVISWLHSFARLGTLVERQAAHDAALAREAQEVGRLLNHVAVQLQDRISGIDERLETYADRNVQAELKQAVLQAQSDVSGLQAASTDHEARSALIEARLDDHSSVIEGLQAWRVLREEQEASAVARIASVEAELAAHREQEASATARFASLEAELAAHREREASATVRFASLEAELAVQREREATATARFASLGEVDAAQAAHVDGLEHKLQMTASIVEGMVLRDEQAKDGAKALDQFYADFEETFRGDRELVRKRSEPYLQWVRDAGAGVPDAPVLDVGCGRGEWLELLRESGLHARGIDLNRVFVDACRSMGLAVTEQDAIQGMRALPPGSIGAVTSMHLVEHLSFETMIALIDEARRVLSPGGLLVLETPNPENLTVASHTFYYDPTHRNPLPPVVLRWIVESRGFEEVRIERLTHARDIPVPDPVPDEVPGAASMNVLISSLGMAPDYAIVARRP